MQIKLSTEDVVTFRPVFTHKAHKAHFQALNKGVSWKPNEEGKWNKEIPADNIALQYEAVFPLLIEKIERKGQEIPFTPDWLDELPQKDYDALEEALVKIREGNPEREKNR